MKMKDRKEKNVAELDKGTGPAKGAGPAKGNEPHNGGRTPVEREQNNAGLTEKPKNLAMVLVLYLLGLFMGALDTGIVSPARGVIQNQLGVSETVGIWMITIYTLAYATSIPISGKLADRYGRKLMYVISIFLFGLGSLICSLSASVGGFPMLLAGRVIQAIGGGGIMPIVTAEIGTTFPEEKRGMALGMVGGIYGIANILGSSAGSGILGIAGNSGWHWLFLINVPISLFIVVGALFTLENHKNPGPVKRMDLAGSAVLSGMILSLMYGLTNVKFFDFVNSVGSLKVYPFLALFLLLIPVFVLIERRAADPIIPLKYFSNRNMVITFIVSILVGVALMGMVFVPQFAENALKIKTGSGGYFVTILGLFAGIGAPLSGRLIDRYGPKVVLMGGFSFTLFSGLFLAFVATQAPSVPAILFSLFLMGLGMGFTMGTPLNYMILSLVPKNESSSALSTLSLVRSIGTVLSPALMIGFIANAGAGLQNTLMDSLPPPPTKLEIRQVEELKPLLAQIKANPDLASKVPADMLDVDKMMNANAKTFDMKSGSGTLPEDLLKSLQSADVTNIVDRVKNLADYMFRANVTPEVIQAAAGGVQKGIDGLNTGISEMDKAAVDLKASLAETRAKQDALKKSITDMDQGKTGIRSGIDGLSQAIAGMDQGLAKQKQTLAGMKAALVMLDAMPAGSSGTMPAGTTTGKPAGSVVGVPAGMPVGAVSGMPAGMVSGMPAGAASGMPTGASSGMDKKSFEKGIAGIEGGIRTLQAKRDAAAAQKTELEKKLAGMETAQTGMRNGVAGMDEALAGMGKGLSGMVSSRELLIATTTKMTEIRDAIPGAFEASRVGYLNTLEGMRPELEGIFQTGLNGGFHDMYLMVALLSGLAIVVLIFYNAKKRETADETAEPLPANVTEG